MEAPRVCLYNSPSSVSFILTGFYAVDKKRKELGFPALQTFVIEVISAKDVALDNNDPELLKKAKMSSTFIREWVANRERGEAPQIAASH